MKFLIRTMPLGGVTIMLLVSLLACTSPSRRPLPPNNPFQQTSSIPQLRFQQGVATGDVTSHSAQVWVRTQVASTVQVSWWPQLTQKEWAPAFRTQQKSLQVETKENQDYTRIIPLLGLESGMSYRYRVETVSQGKLSVKGDVATGGFSTLPAPEVPAPFTFMWSGDLGGQGHCRTEEKGYRIFDTIRATKPSFAILLGDLVYADGPCPSPPNIRGSDFIAHDLAGFRAKHRYQREDPSFQQFLATIPIYAVWDDHEVVNNFSGTQEPLMPIGRQAFREYWPIQSPEEDLHRMYRNVRYGGGVEIFLLDTRQYRSVNSEQDGPHKTMLGQEQLDWLLDGLRESSATWKVIATSVPLGISKEGYGSNQGNDNWARGKIGTGFHHELQHIVSVIVSNRVANVVWLSGDVHFAQANAFDPNRDGVVDFHEFIAGPLSAGTLSAPMPQPDLNPTTLFSGGGFPNFGVIQGDQQALTVQFIDETGTIRFEQTFPASSF